MRRTHAVHRQVHGWHFGKADRLDENSESPLSQEALSLKRERNVLTFGDKLSCDRLATEELTALKLLQWLVPQLELPNYIHIDNSEAHMTGGNNLSRT